MTTATSTESLWTEALIEKRVFLPVSQVNEKMDTHLVQHLKKRFAGKCIDEGYVRPSSIQLKNYSCGKITNQGIHIVVFFYCLVCNPSAGVEVQCTVSDTTKAGIHALVRIPEENIEPLSVYVLRDHDSRNEQFEKVQKGDIIRLKLLGTRFELDDPSIHAVAEFVGGSKATTKNEEESFSA
jgi:DNA-directed RNA polymerase subunit E'/Rpb7